MPIAAKNLGRKTYMGKRGQKPLEERVGIDKFKELLKRLSIQEIAKLYGENIRTVYRARTRIEQKQKMEKRFDPIDKFEAIPEIQSFIDYQKTKGASSRKWVSLLRQYWKWIKEDHELTHLQRPALWDERHIKVILKKLHEKKVALYHPKQALRRFFESQGNHELQKHILIKARVEDMRSPKGTKREMQFYPSEVPQILGCVNGEMQRLIKTHITVKSREQSLLDTEWNAINWNDQYYGFPMATIMIYETKTKGGTYWEHCPLDLWFSDLSKDLYEEWERQGKPSKGKIFNISYEDYRKAWIQISEKLGKKFEAHDCRRSAGGWLRDLGLSDLALGQYDPLSGKAVGYTGVGWENPNIYYQRYGRRNPKTIWRMKAGRKSLTLGRKTFSALPSLSNINFPLFS